jgi:hypothetical protein
MVIFLVAQSECGLECLFGEWLIGIVRQKILHMSFIIGIFYKNYTIVRKISNKFV